jgi:peptidoglycan hydrolase-like protein with peptidoglycan-binding domain
MRRRSPALALLATVAVAGAGAAVAALVVPRHQRPAGQDSEMPPATTSITRDDLTNSSQHDGTLGYLGEKKINAGPAGTVTWIASTGSVIERDKRLYAVDGTPVRLMYGAEPMYRTLKTGDKGKDVRQVEENLAALGYTGFTPDDEYTAKTAAAVTRWQRLHKLRQTGAIGPNQIAFAGSAVRVQAAGTATGDRIGPGAPVLTVTGSERVVRFKLPVADGESAKVGARVSVRLPDGTEAPAKVSAVGRTVSADDDAPDKTPKIEILVSFDAPAKVKGLDQSPVSVNLTGETRRNVLSVPVNALLALPTGGFGVQAVENGRTRDVPVELGMFGQGRVEISGAGVREGMKVGVPTA